MTTTCIHGCVIAHTGKDGDPIALGKSDLHLVSLHLDTRRQPVMKATITRRRDGQTACMSLAPQEVANLFQEAREREVVGLVQPHLGTVMCNWLDAGLYMPFVKAA